MRFDLALLAFSFVGSTVASVIDAPEHVEVKRIDAAPQADEHKLCKRRGGGGRGGGSGGRHSGNGRSSSSRGSSSNQGNHLALEALAAPASESRSFSKLRYPGLKETHV